MILIFKILRFDPEVDEEPYYKNYEVEAEPNQRLLDCLNKIRWEKDPSLSYRWSCSHGICGSDGMTINGTPAFACQKLVKDYDTKEFTIEPLAFFPIVKDLIVDMKPFFTRMKQIHPKNWKINPVEVSKEFLMSIEEHEEIKDAIKCIMCGCCTSACPVNLEEDPDYIGPAAVLRAQRYIMDARREDVKERIAKINHPQGVWGCKVYGECTRVCPKSIKVTKKILDLKKFIPQV
jgi:succinate dehydrogenase / fumarate reductase iron-sulfur subunit